ncbi:MAG: hypothetical protein GYA55_04405 [SAR324 cluster bacterium]|uniref:Uncharacterized protein n=1 Tax=SAR324 cluster bacterium TaxID=2024889 RepID=A0A7X9FQH5_9DELT|nr:hypothetical protein [SAR324 cluster bacterium]
MQVKPKWEEITEFCQLAAKMVEKYPERFGSVEVDRIVAYGCTNKERPDKKAKLYEMSGETEPESFTNSKTYFIKMFMSDWESRDEAAKLLIVASALSRIDPDNPGRVGPLDYRDQNVMVKTFGPDWQDRSDVPHLLKDQISFRE